MFDFVTKHKRFLQIILALTLIPFAFFGLESYTKILRGTGEVAVAEGIPISLREFGDEMRRYQERLREMLGQNADPSDLDTPELRQGILESMIAQRLVMAQAIKERMSMPREQVVAAILASPDFQQGGKFSPERYAA